MFDTTLKVSLYNFLETPLNNWMQERTCVLGGIGIWLKGRFDCIYDASNLFSMRPVKVIQKANASGFTLLETLISLAILSVVSLALFQSTTALLRITDSAVGAGNRTLESAISTRTFRVSVSGLTPAWEEQEQDIFFGNATTFSGLSTDVPTFSAQSLQKLTYTLVQGEGDVVLLEVQAAQERWVLHELQVSQASFSYLGSDQKWYEVWPPKEVPSTGFFDDVNYKKMPQLPLAIRLHGAGGRQNLPGHEREVDWVVPVLVPRTLPIRVDF